MNTANTPVMHHQSTRRERLAYRGTCPRCGAGPGFYCRRMSVSSTAKGKVITMSKMQPHRERFNIPDPSAEP